MWPVQDVRSTRRKERDDSSDSHGRHRKKRREDDAKDDKRAKQDRDGSKVDRKEKKDGKDSKESKRPEREEERKRDGGSKTEPDKKAKKDVKDGKEKEKRPDGKDSRRPERDSGGGRNGDARDTAGRQDGQKVGSDRPSGREEKRTAGPAASPKQAPSTGQEKVDSGNNGGRPAPEPAPEPQKAAGKSKNWREEVVEEGELDLSTDDEGAEKKLAAARARRMQIMKDKKAEEEAKGDAPEKKEASPEKQAEEKQTEEEAKKKEGSKDTSKKADDNPNASMFDDSAKAGKELKIKAKHTSGDIGMTGASGDDWDDADGYYIPKIGEVMDDRYLVVETSGGKGVFANVVKAKDQKDTDQGLVAIKIMRANDMMTKNTEKEVAVLERLSKTEPKKDKRERQQESHVVKLLATFAYRKHICLVFECMWDDLRAALKKYTKNKGMSLTAVRAYTQQLFHGLKHVHGHKIIHADIKPDNILISKGHNVVKFCDFGTAVELKDVMVSPYLASRFYRSPEIILGCQFCQAVDTWALGCTLFELFTGKVLFASKSNNDHLRVCMEVKGKIPVKVIKKGAVWKNHFNDELDFKHVVDITNPATPLIKVITNLTATRSIKDLVLERVGPEKRKSDTNEDKDYVKKAIQFADLIEQTLALDPEKRIKPEDALAHPFLLDPKKKTEHGDRHHERR